MESELARRLAHTAVDDIMTTEKVAIQNDVLMRRAEMPWRITGSGLRFPASTLKMWLRLPTPPMPSAMWRERARTPFVL